MKGVTLVEPFHKINYFVLIFKKKIKNASLLKKKKKLTLSSVPSARV